MKKIVFLALISALIFPSCREETHLEYCIGNDSSQTILVSFFDGETTNPEFYPLTPEEGLGLGVFDLGVVKEPSEYFNSLWKNASSEFRVYSADTVLLKVWKPDYNPQSTQKEFYRESDWRTNESGEWSNIYIDYYFQITDSDLPPADSTSSSGKALNQ